MKEIFVVGTWLSTPERIQQTKTTIAQIRALGFPVCLVAHCPAPTELQEMVDYFIYEKENVLSTDFLPTFIQETNGVRREKVSEVGYHAVACLMNIRNAVDLVLAQGHYTHMHYIEADIVTDLLRYAAVAGHILKTVKACFIQDPGHHPGYRTDLFSAELLWYTTAIPRVRSWEEYVLGSVSSKLLLEQWILPYVVADALPLPNFPVKNMFTQSDYGVSWDE